MLPSPPRPSSRARAAGGPRAGGLQGPPVQGVGAEPAAVGGAAARRGAVGRRLRHVRAAPGVPAAWSKWPPTKGGATAGHHRLNLTPRLRPNARPDSSASDHAGTGRVRSTGRRCRRSWSARPPPSGPRRAWSASSASSCSCKRRRVATHPHRTRVSPQTRASPRTAHTRRSSSISDRHATRRIRGGRRGRCHASPATEF